MIHNQIKMKSSVMVCYGMSQEKPGKFQGGTDILIWFLKDKYEFSFRESGEENSGGKNNKALI